jgi:hypothetical protein
MSTDGRGAGSASRVTLTSGGSATVVGKVREFGTGDPVEGMSCRAIPRQGDDIPGDFPAAAARSDSDGRFVVTAACRRRHLKVTVARAGKTFTGDLVLGERELP